MEDRLRQSVQLVQGRREAPHNSPDGPLLPIDWFWLLSVLCDHLCEGSLVCILNDDAERLPFVLQMMAVALDDTIVIEVVLCIRVSTSFTAAWSKFLIFFTAHT